MLKNEQGNIYETIHGNKVNDLFIYCYLIDLLNQNDNAFDDILKILVQIIFKIRFQFYPNVSKF